MQDIIQSNVNPKHYKNYIGEIEWVEAMCQIPTLREPIQFKAALEFTLRGYLDRKGQKDDELQELKKCRFYLQYLIMYMENDCKVVSAKKVHETFTDKKDDIKKLYETGIAALELCPECPSIVGPATECECAEIKLKHKLDKAYDGLK